MRMVKETTGWRSAALPAFGGSRIGVSGLGDSSLLRLVLVLGGLVISGLGFSICRSFASEVVVLKSSDLTPYNTVASAIENRRPSGVETVLLADDKKQRDLAVHAIWAAKPDVIVALGVRALDVASAEFPSVPMIFGMVADAYQYADRQDAIAGIELIPSETQVLRAIRAVFPRVDDVAIVFDAERSGKQAGKFSSAGKAMGIKIHQVRFAKDTDVENQLRSIAGSCDCLIIYPDPVLLSDKVFADVVYQAFGLGLPAVAYSSAFARRGALMSVEADYPSVGKDLSEMVEQVLKGGSPRAIGIHPPPRVRITINLAVANHLGIVINISPDTLPSMIVQPIDLIADRPGS